MTEYAVAIPQVLFHRDVDSTALSTYLAKAEELGFHSGWVQEHVLGDAGVLDPLTTLAFAAASCHRLRLGCAVFVTPRHHPIALAKSLASLDQLSAGRLEIGVGAGSPGPFELAFGVKPGTRVDRFAEGLVLMKALWTQPTVNCHGQFWQFDGASVEPKPRQQPYPPLWMGGSSLGALSRAAQHADGFFGAGVTSTQQFAAQVSAIRALLSTGEREDTGFRVAKRVYVAIEDDPVLARHQLCLGLTQLYGRDDLMPVAVAGTRDDCVTGLQHVVDAGAQLILLNPLYDEARQIERLAGEVIPRLR